MLCNILLTAVVNASYRRILMIDCDEMCQGGSDSSLLRSLASQTGYWPYFTFLDSVNNMLDLASAGVIGKPGMYHQYHSNRIVLSVS